MFQYFYNFAGLTIGVNAPFPLTITEESQPFLTSLVSPEHHITLTPCTTLPPLPGEGLFVQENYYTRLNGMPAVYHSLFPGEPPVVLVHDAAPGETVCYFLPAGESWVKETAGLLNLLELDNLLLRHDRLILHASFVLWQGKAILFSAPSGTGKSTQADLWEKYQASTTVNSDRAALSRKDGIWYAHGLPFAGSSRIFRKESAPVSVLVCLSQGKENTLEPLPPLGCLRKLLPEVNLRRWEEGSVSKATELLMELIAQVPVYHLSCRPDEEATLILRRMVEGESSTAVRLRRL